MREGRRARRVVAAVGGRPGLPGAVLRAVFAGRASGVRSVAGLCRPASAVARLRARGVAGRPPAAVEPVFRLRAAVARRPTSFALLSLAHSADIGLRSEPRPQIGPAAALGPVVWRGIPVGATIENLVLGGVACGADRDMERSDARAFGRGACFNCRANGARALVHARAYFAARLAQRKQRGPLGGDRGDVRVRRALADFLLHASSWWVLGGGVDSRAERFKRKRAKRRREGRPQGPGLPCCRGSKRSSSRR